MKCVNNLLCTQGDDSKTNLFFSSSKGNFVVSLAHPIVSYVNGVETVDTNAVIGISYLREY
ncbi:hypothetical protein GCM10008908_01380 [Clostridium subterminale]|uniref:Uncharacterized protein n=1 Tax=Clostridium subterminale TaxID=1550 RepID=A0ABN1KFF0_CLOSU